MSSYSPVEQTGKEDQDSSLNVNASRALKSDTYDAVLYALAKVLDTSGPDSKDYGIVLFLALCFHLACVILQTGIVFMMIEFTLERRWDQWEKDGNLTYHTQAILNSIATNTQLNATVDARTLKLCKEDHNIPYSQSVMTTLWGAKILPSLWQGLMFTLIVAFRLPTASEEQRCTKQDAKSGNMQIIRLPLSAKIFTILVVQIPRIALMMYLYFMGAKFLMLAPSLGVLILKSIGLAFISQVSDVLAVGFFSALIQSNIKKTVVAFDDHGGENHESHWNLWGSSIFKLLVVLIVSLYCCRIVWGALQGMRQACTDYEHHFILPECEPTCGKQFFGFTLYN